jgi:hypothetical protein
MSEITKRMAGTFIPEEKKPPVAEWLQGQLRTGYLRPVLNEFVRSQPEALDLDRVQVDEVTPAVIRCRIPHFIVDHESTRPLRDDVEFDLNPLTGSVLRRC